MIDDFNNILSQPNGWGVVGVAMALGFLFGCWFAGPYWPFSFK
jgi:hypothetical protein